MEFWTKLRNNFQIFIKASNNLNDKIADSLNKFFHIKKHVKLIKKKHDIQKKSAIQLFFSIELS